MGRQANASRTGKEAAEGTNKLAKLLDTIVASVDRSCGRGSVMRFGAGSEHRVEATSSGSLRLDRALGVGGYPRGRLVEIFGPESSGKTTLCLHAIAEAQRGGAICAFVDAEHALDIEYARRLGVDLERLLIAQPGCGEEALQVTQDLLTTGHVPLVVVDSVAALVPRAEIDGDMGDQHVGSHARLMSQAMRKLSGLTAEKGANILFVNQLRQKIGVMFGPSETTTGGNALRFYASIRLDIRRIQQIKGDEGPLGARTRVKVVKNKLAAPFRVAEFDIRYGIGVDRAAELLELAEEAGVVSRSGAWYRRGDERLGQGREATLERLRAEEGLRAEIEAALTATTESANVPPAALPTKAPATAPAEEEAA